MTRVKFYSGQQLFNVEKNVSKFLKKEVKQLIDIKFSAVYKDSNNEFTIMIIYK